MRVPRSKIDSFRQIDLQRPRLTVEEVEKLKVGDQIRNIPVELFHVTHIGKGKNQEDLALLAVWSYRHQCWIHHLAGYHDLRALYTPKEIPR